jgi:glycosyltransferase involved in cell wall biosynthesis
MDDESYCLLTACKNEAGYIGETISSLIQQSLRPRRWIILDDGSTDGTAELVKQLSRGRDWIRLHRLEPRPQRSFGAQYRAIMRGGEMLQGLSFDFIGALDADISFESANYFSTLIEEFRRCPRLGIAGGVICEKDRGAFRERRENVACSVAGAVQMFRRQVFEAIGGYTPLEYGGSDALAVLKAGMDGWEVRSLPELRVLHHRASSTADGRLRGAFRRGLMDAAFGYHPVFTMLKYARRLAFNPRVIGSLCSLAGYSYYKLKGGKPAVPKDIVSYLRKVQVERTWQAIHLKGFDKSGMLKKLTATVIGWNAATKRKS